MITTDFIFVKVQLWTLNLYRIIHQIWFKPTSKFERMISLSDQVLPLEAESEQSDHDLM